MKRYVHKYKDMLESCLILLIIGFFTGIVCTSKMNLNTFDSLQSIFISTLVVPTDIEQFFIQQCLSNILLCLFLFFLGFSLIGIVFIQGGVFLKGFQIGFSCALFVMTYQIKGVAGIVMTLIPQVFLDTVAIIMIATTSIVMSGHLIARLNEHKPIQSYSSFLNHRLTELIFSIGLVVMSSLMKSTVGLWMIELFTQI